MPVMDINIATGLREDLEANKNKSLLSGTSIALFHFMLFKTIYHK